MYSWMRLTWDWIIEDLLISMPTSRLMKSANRSLLLCFTAATLRRKSSSSTNFSIARILSRSVIQSVADLLADQRGEPRIGLAQPAARGHAVGLVVELLRPELGEVAQHALAQQPGVQRGDAVGRAAADDAEVGHPHRLLRLLLDDAHPLEPVEVAGEPGRHLAQEAAVDFVDDLQVPRQEPLEHADRPALQRLGQQRVVGVAGGVDGQLPGLAPLDVLAVEEDPHQLGHDQRRMRVVHLDEDLVGERQPVVGVHLEAADDVLHRAGDEEVLLAQAQLAAGVDAVVGIENLGQVLGHDLVFHRLDVGAAAEILEVEVVGGSGRPQPAGC